MLDLKITKADLDENNFYKEDSVDVDGVIEIDGDLGTVCFRGSVKTKKYVFAKAGSGIEAGLGIKAGEGIEAGWGIKAGLGIKAGWGIKAGDGIRAGEGIEAGWGIEAGDGIKAGLSISCKSLSTPLRIFAGICGWKIPTEAEMTITGEIRKGTVAYGIVEEKSNA